MTMDVIAPSNNYQCSEGPMVVERYKLIDNKIFFNKQQYFFVLDNSDVQPLWEYTIGGNQPLQKWLKDRKGTKLTNADIGHYLSIMSAVNRIIVLMDQIDSIIASD